MRCFTANQSLLWKDTLILVNATSLVAYNLSSSIPDEAQYHVFAPSRCEEENFLCMWAHQDDGKCTTASNMGNKDLLLAVTVMSNGTILVFRVDVGTVVHVARPQEGVCLDSPLRIVHAASWTADGDVVGMVTEAGDIFSYHLSRKTWSAKPIWRAPSSMVAFLPTGDIAAMCTQQGNKKVMDVFSSTNGGIRNIPLVSNRPVLSMVSHRTLALVVVTMDDGTFCVVTLHDAKDALFTKRWHHKPILSVAWGTLDGTTLLTGGWEGVLCTWSTVTFSMTPLPHLPGPIRSITYSCTDPTCVALILSTGRCLIVDTVASKIVRNFAGISLLGDGLYFQKMTTGWMKGRKVLALYHGTSDEIRFQNSKQGFTVGALHAAGANRVVPQEDISAAPSYSISNAVLYRTDQQHECIALFTTSSIRLCSGSTICTLRFFHYNSNPSRNEFILNTVIHDPHTGFCSNAMMLSAHPTGACVVSGGPLETKIWIMSDGKSPQVHWECQRVLFRGTSDVAFSSDGSIFACLHRSTAESSRLSVYDTERVLNSGAWYPMFTMEYVDASSMPDQAQKNNHEVPTSEKAVRHGQQMKTPLRSLFFACNDQELFCSDDRTVYMWNILQHATKRSEVDEELNKNLKHFSAWRVETNHRVEAKKGKSDSSCATIQCVHPIPSSMRLKTRSLIGESQQKSLTEFTNLMILLSTNEFLVVQVRDETDNSSCTSSPVRIFSQVLLREMAHAELPVLQFVIVDEQVHLLLDSSKSRAVIWNNPAWRALITSDDTAEVERDSFEDMTTNRRTQTRSVLRPMLGGSLAVRNSSGSAPLAGSTPSISERLSGPSHELPPMTAILKAFFAASVAVQ